MGHMICFLNFPLNSKAQREALKAYTGYDVKPEATNSISDPETQLV